MIHTTEAMVNLTMAQTVEKPLTGFSDKFLQSAARTPCSPTANNSHCDALRAACGGCALHSAAALDSAAFGPRFSLGAMGFVVLGLVHGKSILFVQNVSIKL